MFSDYFSVHCLDEGKKRNSKLPQWLDLPKIFYKGYTSRNNGVPGDFLLLAEGSEVEGPIPRFVIPKDGNSGFDLDKFAICLMSTDMQTQNGRLNFCMGGDAQLLMSQNQEGLYVFVQHFTLHDSMARGFVRPFCLAYLSIDKDKLVYFYERLSSEFNKVVTLFKIGNFLLFFRDMSHILSDLQYTREKHMEGVQTEIHVDYEDDSTSHSVAMPSALRPQPEVKVQSTTSQSQPEIKIQSTTSQGHQASSMARADSHPPIGTPSTYVTDSAVATNGKSMEKDGDGGDMTNNTPVGGQAKEGSPPPDNVDDSRSSKEISESDQGENLTLLEKPLEVQSGTIPTPSPSVKEDPNKQSKEFDSAIKEVRDILTIISNLLEKHQVEVKERFSPKPSPAPRETPLDSENFDMARHLEAPADSTQGITSSKPSWIRWKDTDDSYQPKLRKSLRSKIQKKLRTFEELTQPTPDGLDLLYSLYRYFDRSQLALAMELDDIKDLGPPTGLLTIGRIVYINFLANFESYPHDAIVNPVDEDPTTECVGPTFDKLVKQWVADEVAMGYRTRPTYVSPDAEIGRLTPTSLPHCDDGHEGSAINRGNGKVEGPADDDILHSIQGRTTDSPSRTLSQPAPRPTCLDVKVTHNDCGNKDNIAGSRTAVVSIADHISNLNSTKRIGSGILKVFQLYDKHAADMAYSLLIGRLLIIYSSLPANEAEIREIVTALWFFVPGNYRVLPWTTSPLSSKDVPRLRLVGMLKKEESLVPYLNYTSTSFFDLNKKRLTGPSYRAGLLAEALNKVGHFQEDSAFIALIHSILFTLASKAFLYFHGFCMVNPRVRIKHSSYPTRSWDRRILRYNDSKTFFKEKLKLNGHDASVVMYLTKVVRDQISRGDKLADDCFSEMPLKLYHDPHW